MTEFEFEIKLKDSGRIYTDKFDVPDSEEPEKYCRKVIDNFNAEEDRRANTIKNYNAQYREFIRVKSCTGVIFCNFHKFNIVTVTRGDESYDIWQCQRCFIFRKRKALNDDWWITGTIECVPERTCNDCNKVFKTIRLYQKHKEQKKHKAPVWLPDGI